MITKSSSHKLPNLFVVISIALGVLSLAPGQAQKVEGQTYSETINQAGIEMVRVPAGKFMMGSPVNEKDRGNNEGPQHTVSVSSFYMGKYEVTQLQWRAVSKLPKLRINLPSDPAKYKGDNLPVEQINWHEAVEFCERLSKATGKSYRLPTEAEWEYACRAGATGADVEDLQKMAWYFDNSETTMHAVGAKQANRFGLYDMQGNVWEMCADWYSDTYYSRSPSSNPKGPGVAMERVIRGGCWYCPVQNLRSAHRSSFPPEDHRSGLGFRLVRTAN